MANSRVWMEVPSTKEIEDIESARTIADGSKFKITLRRDGDPSKSVYADLSLEHGTATAGDDYIQGFYGYFNGYFRAAFGGATPRITFAANEMTKELVVYISNDHIAEPDETLRVSITGAGITNTSESVGIVSGQSSYTLTIDDNDTNHNPDISPIIADDIQRQFNRVYAGTELRVDARALFSDPDGDPLTLRAFQNFGGDRNDSLPGWLSFDGRYFTGTPPKAGESLTIRLAAFDNDWGVAYQDFQVSPKAETTVDDYRADTGTSGKVTVGSQKTGTIESANDADWFAVSLEKDKDYIFSLKGQSGGGGTLQSGYLNLYDGNGNFKASGSASGNGLYQQISYHATAAGTFYLAASAVGTGTYTVAAALGSTVTTPIPSASTFVLPIGDGAPTPEIDSKDAFYLSYGFGPEFTGHLGADWKHNNASYVENETHDRVNAIADGKVLPEKKMDAWGNYVTIEHSVDTYYIDGHAFNLVYSLYGHLQDRQSIVGEVKKGAQIGIIGQTGANNPHLHLQICTDLDAVDDGGYDNGKYVKGGTYLYDGKVYRQIRDTGPVYFIDPQFFIDSYTSGKLSKNNDTASTSFSPYAYAAANPDLFQAFSNDPSQLISHYINFGRSEGRTGGGFQPYAYAANNPDLLAAYGTDIAQLSQHFISYGRTENRTATGFDPYAYAAENPDLYAAYGINIPSLVQHYAQYGHTENRATTGFNPYGYAALNSDLYNAFGTDVSSLLGHYATTGNRENRQTTGFDPFTYAAKNADLFATYGTNVNSLVNHYVNHGMTEGRLAS